MSGDVQVRIRERLGVRVPRATRRNIYVSSRVAGNRVMNGVRTFLEEVLKLRVNAEKSAVARPWDRKFLGFSVTMHRESRLRIAAASVHRLTQKVRDLMRAGRGRSLAHTIEELNPLLRGWINYFRLTESKGTLEALDGWVRRRLRCLLWRQWKRPRTRASKLRALGLDVERARHSAGNGHGPWWNAGASHMNQALPAKYLTIKGLVSLKGTHQQLQSLR
jgi:RNA-directed DNA polymerase